MKNTHIYSILFFIIILSSCSPINKLTQNNGEEHDDMYFSAKDRKELTYANVNNSKSNTTEENTTLVNPTYSQPEEITGISVNPDYVQQYSEQSRLSTNGYDSYSTPAYFEPNYSFSNNPRNFNNNVWVNNNAWGNNWNTGFFGGFNNDPFFCPPRVGWNNGWNAGLGFGWGNTFYNRWGWNSWQRPWFGNTFNSFYNDPWNRWNGGFGARPIVVVTNPSSGGTYRPTRYYGPRYNTGGSSVIRTTRSRATREQSNDLNTENSDKSIKNNNRYTNRTRNRASYNNNNNSSPGNNNNVNSTRTRTRAKSPKPDYSNRNRTKKPSYSSPSRNSRNNYSRPSPTRTRPNTPTRRSTPSRTRRR